MTFLAYFCGSISNAVLVCRITRLSDPRFSGSGNPGTTNVLRIGGKKVAIIVFILDFLKGMLPVWSAMILKVDEFWLNIIAISVCVGHIWPIFFKFKGGKGMATKLGAIAAISWDLTAIMAGIWLIVVLLSGYASLGTIVSALIIFFYIWVIKPKLIFLISVLSFLILLRHQKNIKRLYCNQEPRIWIKLKKTH